ncbi:MAG: UDP-4-amino-4,6-dideoxy-N-acetyl-beta-L-altrosamine transaminase [Nitrospirae bacterium]|nr:UDP-4-amino-4,6-dideoxy-N-acetyl-beta-L-altrosamine transaminase [Nitrospirota bacterium]
MDYIPYARQSIDEEDISAVVDVLRSDWLTQGPKIVEFEKVLADYCGAKYAVAVSSGTAALHIACLSAGLTKGKTGWTTPLTFAATANSMLYCGAEIDFVDIDPATLNISVPALKDKLSKRHIKPNVVIPVHFAGLSCDMEEIYGLSKEYKFSIIEDACHAIGGIYKGLKVGSCYYSDMTGFSFHPAKNMTTGEGGMVMTNDEELYQKLTRYRTHGITRDPKFMINQPDGSWYYEQTELGMNYRITDIQAALGISQLKRLDQFNAKRNELVNRYDKAFSELPIILPPKQEDIFSPFHLYVIRLRLDKIKKTRKEVFDFMKNAGIGVNVHYIPVHLHPYYQRLGFKQGEWAESERYYESAITLPLFPLLTYSDQDRVIAALCKILN